MGAAQRECQPTEFGGGTAHARGRPGSFTDIIEEPAFGPAVCDRSRPGLKLRGHLIGRRATEHGGFPGGFGRWITVADKNLHATDGHSVTGGQHAIGRRGQCLAPTQRAVAALEVTDRPARCSGEDFGVKPACLFVVQHHVVRGSPSERHPFARDERDHGVAGNGIANEEEGDGGGGHAVGLFSLHHAPPAAVLGGRE